MARPTLSPRFNRSRGLGATTAVLSLIGSAVLPLALGVAPVEAASGHLVALGAPAPLPAGSRLLGPAASDADLRVDFTLAPSHPAALRRELEAVTTPGNADYRHYLVPGQFTGRFGASTAAISSVRAGLERLGLPPGSLEGNHLAITLSASVGALDRALDLHLERYRTPTGAIVVRNDTAPKVPAALGAHLVGIDGLDSRAVVVPEGLVRESPSPAPKLVAHEGPAPDASCASAITADGAGYTPDQIAAAYDMSGLYGAGDFGAGVSVGIIEFSSYSSSDLSAYAGCLGIAPSIRAVPVDGGPGNADESSVVEAELDIEDVAGLAPDANLVVYEGPNDNGNVSNATAYDVYAAAIDQDQVQVITTSWGSCEASIESSDLQAEDTLFEQAALQGQTIVAAAGDSGSEDCYGTLNGPAGRALAVDDPASQPYVTGVGGTTLTLSPTRAEVVWNTGINSSDPGAGGGGLSSIWPRPVYQTDAAASLDVLGAASVGSCTLRGGCREVPDVAVDAGSPYAIYCSVSFALCGRGGWTALGGTSAAAPTFASIVALADASSACLSSLGTTGTAGASLGLINPELYELAGSSLYADEFNDITSGNNDLTGTNNGEFSAGPGYNLAAGLGSPIAGDGSDDGLVAGLCSPSSIISGEASSGLSAPSLTKLIPAVGREKGRVKVVLTGEGFTGASSVRFGVTPATSFRVASSTEIVAITPAGTGRVHVRVTTRAGTSAEVRGNVYTYEAVPVLKRIAPPSGSAAGGEQVVLVGSGFSRATAVRFGSVAAIFKVRSATRIVATVPKGHGSVAVVVSSAIGRSAGVLFRYG